MRLRSLERLIARMWWKWTKMRGQPASRPAKAAMAPGRSFQAWITRGRSSRIRR